MKYAPVVIPTLCRYDHFVACVESLKANALADKTELIVALDFPPAEKYADGWRRIGSYLDSLGGFARVTVIRREKNLGAIANIKAMVAETFERHDRLIFSEDDNIFAPCFLDYVNRGLEKYENDKTIDSVSGYSYPVEMRDSTATVVKMQRYFSDWGFGVWKDRYERIKGELDNAYIRKILKDGKTSSILRRKSPKNYVYAFSLLRKHDLRPMDYTNSIYQIVNDLYTIMPKATLVRNEGFDNTGVHCNLDDPQNEILRKLLSSQVLDTRQSFPDIVLDEAETDEVNERVNASAVGNYSKTAFRKTAVKAFLLRSGLLDLAYSFKKKR